MKTPNDTPAEFDFSALLHPFGEQAFFATHWERKPLLLRRGDDHYYRSLLSLHDIEELISRGDARYPAIRLTKGGAFFPPEAYTRDVKYGDEFFRGVPDVEKIFTEYTSGATVSLPGLHRLWSPLGRLCSQMEAQLDHAVHANAYLTSARAAGFTPHYDTHEVFVLQIAGSKQWRIYPPPLSLPHRNQPFNPEHYTPPAEPLMQLELAAGDLLYLPRGYVHTTTTDRHFSAHVTVGITVYTWVEVLSELVQDRLQDASWRGALPCGFAHLPEARALARERVEKALETLCQDVDSDALIQRVAQRVRAAQPRLGARFEADPERVGPSTPMQVVPRRDYRITHEPESVVLEIDGRRVRLQSAVAPVLHAMCEIDEFTAEALPDCISLEARLTLVRYLHGLGFLQPCQHARS